MAEYKYVLVCLPLNDDEPIIEQFNRKFDAECHFRRLSNDMEFNGAYIEKIVPKTYKYFEVEKTIKLI